MNDVRRRRLRDGRTVAVHRNRGLRKLCPCARSKWAKCSHPWHFSFAWRGKLYRLSLDKYAGNPVESKTEADRIADDLRTQIRAGAFVGIAAPTTPELRPECDPAIPVVTVRKAGKSWETKRGYQLVASRDNDYRFERFCRFVLPGTEPPIAMGDKPVAAVTASDIEAFRHERRTKGLSAVTTNHDLKLLRKMFAWFVRERLIEDTPFRFRGEAVIKLDRETPRDRRFADPADEAKLLNAAEPLLHDVIVALLDTCCRPGEILTLQWRDVDFLRREVTIRPENVKTREGRRIPMTSRLESILKIRRLGPDGEPLGQGRYVFGDATGGQVRLGVLRDRWNEARTVAGLEDLQLRDLRHEAGSRYEEAGVPTTYVSKFMGHSNLTTTTRYLNPTIQHLHSAVQKMDEARRKSANLANSLQTDSAPAEQIPAHDETQPEAKSLFS